MIELKVADRLNGIGEYYFSQKLREIEAMNKAGLNVINLGIGSPDLPPHAAVIAELNKQSELPNTHAYQSYKGSPILRNAIATWYSNRFNVTLDSATQVLPLIGSKEGIVHLCMTYLSKGDQALIPDPGYPTYASAVMLAGAESLSYSLTPQGHWYPDFEALEAMDLTRVKMMWVNYPHMPSGQRASTEVFEKLIAFGKKHNVLICHDNPYSFILNDAPQSIFSVEGAMDTAVELNSLSKSHNMAGWRVGFLCGSDERINEVLRFKSNMDSGMFLPLQLAAAVALQLPDSWYDQINEVYAARRKGAEALLKQIGCGFDAHQSGMFLWAAVPGSFSDGYALSDYYLQSANVFLTPGGIFGSMGKNYIRISLCSPIEKLLEALQRIEKQS